MTPPIPTDQKRAWGFEQTLGAPSSMLTIGLTLDMLDAVRKVVDEDLTTTLVLASVVQANTSEFDANEWVLERWSAPEAPAPDNLRQPVSGYAAALAMGFPRETVRRRINALIAKGLIEQRAEGYFVPARVFTQPGFQDLSRRTFELTSAYFAASERLGLVDPADSALARSSLPRPRAAGRAIDWFVPKVLEEVSRFTRRDPRLAVLFIALCRARHLGARTTAVGLAAEHGLTRETGRRRVVALERLGLVERNARSLAVPRTVFGRPGVAAAFERIAGAERMLLRRLALAGVAAG